MRKKIILSLGTTRDVKSVDVEEDVIKAAIADTRWCHGTAIVGGRRVRCFRRRTLDGYDYKIGDQILGDEPEAYLQNEWIDWRDS